MYITVAETAYGFAAEPTVSTIPSAEYAARIAFVQEYIRELITNEASQDDAKNEVAKAGAVTTKQLEVGDEVGTRAALDLATEASVVRSIHLSAPYAKVPQMLAEFRDEEAALYRRIAAISSEMLSATVSGPQPGVNYTALVREVPQLTARRQFIDKSLFEDTPMFAYMLLDEAHPDKHGLVTRLIITCHERVAMIANLDTSFGRKLTEKQQDYFVSSAWVMKSFLTNKLYHCADE